MAVSFEIPRFVARMERIQEKIMDGQIAALEQLLKDITETESEWTSVQFLSRAYAELKHRNFALSADIVHFIECRLVKACYEQSTAIAVQDAEKGEATQNARRLDANRVEALVNGIDLIIQYHNTGLYDDIDDGMIQRLRQIYAHVFFLKTHHRKLPLLQLQFCIAVFLKVVTGKANNGFDIYSFTIDKVRLIRFLKIVREEITRSPQPVISFETYNHYVKYLLHCPPVPQTLRIPKRVRGMIRMDLKESIGLLDSWDKGVCFEELQPQCQSWLKSRYEKIIEWDERRRMRRQFKELHDTYYCMKQHYSIVKILSYLNGIRDGTPNSPPPPSAITAIKRTLQVIGETIKSTRDTPNITMKLDRILKLITSVSLTERTKDLRQFFSHGYSLEKLEMEKETESLSELEQASVFQEIEKNFREARRWFEYTQTQQNFRIYRRYLGYLLCFKSIDALRNYIVYLGTEFKASLIQTYLPEQLTEAKLLLQHVLQNPESSSSNPLLTSTLRSELDYLAREIQLRIGAIRVENAILGRTVDEYFFLETYISQSTGARLERVHRMARSILRHTKLSKRHTLVEKTDLIFGRELLARLQGAEMNDDRRYIWGCIWQRLARDNFDGIDTLLGRTEQRPDAALDATIETMQQLGLTLDDEDYLQFVNRRLCKSYYHNVFVLDNKYRVLKEIVKDRRAQVAPREALTRMKELRRADETLLQQQYDRLVGRMEELLGHPCFDSTRADQIALEYCLLEVTEILCNLGLFRDNVHELVSLVPVVTGRNLRNYLAHDGLAYDTLTGMTDVAVCNAKWLIKNRFKLYQTSTKNPAFSASQTNHMVLRSEQVFQMQTEWTEQLVRFIQLVKQLAASQLELHMTKYWQSRAALLLEQRNHLEENVLTIAVNGNAARFIDQLLHYRQGSSEDNMFFLLLKHSREEDLKEKIAHIIANPNPLCLRLALRVGLWSEIQAILPGCDQQLAQQIVATAIPDVFRRFPTTFIVQLVELVPPGWLFGINDHLGNTIVHLTVLRGDEHLLWLVLRRYGSLVNVANRFGDFPLLLAIRYHGSAIAKVLLDHGADPWLHPKIIEAIAICDEGSLLERIQQQVQPKLPIAPVGEGFQHNPLRAAIECKHLAMFQQLHRSFKCDLRQGDLLHLAARLNRIELLEYILKELNAGRQHSSGEYAAIDLVNEGYAFTPLMLACGRGHYEAAQLLLQHGANGLYRNENGFTPWHCAVHGGNRRVLKLILAIPGVQVDAVTRDQRSALSIAIETGQSSIQIAVLLKAGVSVRPEHVLRACMLERSAIAELLIAQNLKEFLEARDFCQRTPLMLAVLQGNVAMVRHLLALGANVNAANMMGMRCLHVAALNNHVHLCGVLLALTYLDREAEDNFGRTALVVALEREHLTIVELLLQHGANVQSAYRYRFAQHRNVSLLHKFAIERRPRMVEYLLKKLKFPANILDDDGKTAAMYDS
ncbi:uncharacterized protein LOC125958259 [Anopheles darlingi]|uniref:uncharacterized protein LOC125958259 n=1 Tax=Anopheles darlingi TaxID=43151 RepID=UPI00210014DD|nr:uncharacterized protein LOC125958259 [Anopheles darlingi]XP_049547449.1 uncharacterized protein LOC125958259 [Anopheles darlingi]